MLLDPKSLFNSKSPAIWELERKRLLTTVVNQRDAGGSHRDEFVIFLDAMKNHQQERLSSIPDRREILRKSAVDSDSKFWRGERPISVVQWIGLILCAIAVVAALLSWVRGDYVKVLLVFGGAALLLVVANLAARRKTRSRRD